MDLPPTAWFKSSYSGEETNCVQSAFVHGWHKSSYSDSQTNCLETAHLPPTHFALRDSKSPERGHLTLPAAEWSAFVGAVKRGRV